MVAISCGFLSAEEAAGGAEPSPDVDAPLYAGKVGLAP